MGEGGKWCFQFSFNSKLPIISRQLFVEQEKKGGRGESAIQLKTRDFIFSDLSFFFATNLGEGIKNLCMDE